jgi:multidrug resistance efflux pump
MKIKATPKSHERKHFHLRHAVPVMVWLVAVAGVAGLFRQRAQRFEIVGIARGEVRQVAVSSAGRIKDVSVSLYQPVIAGQTLAVVDTILDNEQTLEAELRAELAGVMAEIEHLAAQLIPTQESMQAETRNLEISRSGDLTRLAMDVDNYRVRVMQLQGSIATDELALGDQTWDRKILEKLLEEDVIAPYELDKVKGQCAGLSKKIEEDSKLLAQAKADMAKAEERLDQFAGQAIAEPSVDQALEVIRKDIGVQEQLMQGLLERLRALKSRMAVEIKSPIEGVIIPIPVQEKDALNQRPGEQVMRRVGEVVRAGDPILAVALKEPTEIVAYVGEQQLSMLKEGMPVELVKIRTPAQIAESQIAGISPTMELMPQRLWRNPNVPQWGQPILINIPPGLSLVPGEVVGIRGL